jgi:hypothetical protein
MNDPEVVPRNIGIHDNMIWGPGELRAGSSGESSLKPPSSMSPHFPPSTPRPYLNLKHMAGSDKEIAALSNSELLRNVKKLESFLNTSGSRFTHTPLPQVVSQAEQSLQKFVSEMNFRQAAWRSPTRAKMSSAKREVAQKEIDAMSQWMQTRGGSHPLIDWYDPEAGSWQRVESGLAADLEQSRVPRFGKMEPRDRAFAPEWDQRITPVWERNVDREVTQFRDIVKDLYGSTTF